MPERYWRLLGRSVPEPGNPAGYAALAARYDLRVPLPSRLAAIAERHHPDSTPEWLMLTPRHAVEDTLQAHLEFALKWEGVGLGVLAALFRVVDPGELARMVRDKPTGAYARRIWFLYEWLTGDRLDVPNAGKVRSVLAVDPERQFAAPTGEISSRHRVRDNLPGTRRFCPLVRRTGELDRYVSLRLGERGAGGRRADASRRDPAGGGVPRASGQQGLVRHRGRTTPATPRGSLGLGNRRGGPKSADDRPAPHASGRPHRRCKVHPARIPHGRRMGREAGPAHGSTHSGAHQRSSR